MYIFIYSEGSVVSDFKLQAGANVLYFIVSRLEDLGNFDGHDVQSVIVNLDGTYYFKNSLKSCTFTNKIKLQLCSGIINKHITFNKNKTYSI